MGECPIYAPFLQGHLCAAACGGFAGVGRYPIPGKPAEKRCDPHTLPKNHHQHVNTSMQVSAGGSLSNSLIGLSRLGHADNVLRDSGELRIAMAGGIGSDSLGSFFSAQAAKAGVTLLSDCVPDSCTGMPL